MGVYIQGESVGKKYNVVEDRVLYSIISTNADFSTNYNTKGYRSISDFTTPTVFQFYKTLYKINSLTDIDTDDVSQVSDFNISKLTLSEIQVIMYGSYVTTGGVTLSGFVCRNISEYNGMVNVSLRENGDYFEVVITIDTTKTPSISIDYGGPAPFTPSGFCGILGTFKYEGDIITVEPNKISEGNGSNSTSWDDLDEGKTIPAYTSTANNNPKILYTISSGDSVSFGQSTKVSYNYIMTSMCVSKTTDTILYLAGSGWTTRQAIAILDNANRRLEEV